VHICASFTSGHALWLNQRKTSCLVLWRRLPEVAAAIAAWATSYGVSDSVMLLDELANGPDVRGTGALEDVSCRVIFIGVEFIFCNVV